MRLAAQTFVFLTLLASPALAQMWPNETGPGSDLLRNSSRQFDRLWQAAPPTESLPQARAGLPRPVAQPAVPMLDWAPPPAVPPAAAPKRPVRRRSSAPRPAPQPTTQAAAPSRQDWERSLNEREREMDALRRRLEEERRRFDAQGKTP